MKKLIITGTANSIIEMPNSLEYDIWGCGSCLTDSEIPRIDVLFELHQYDKVKALYFSEKKVDYSRAGRIFVNSEKMLELFPRAEVYPLEKVLSVFKRKFFTSSAAWILGLAIIEGYKHIEIQKIQCCDDQEYWFEREALSYLIGYAEGMGVNIFFPPDTELLYTPCLYGFDADYENHLEVKLASREKYAFQSVKALLGEFERKSEEMNRMIGAINILKDLEKEGKIKIVEEKANATEKRIGELFDQVNQIKYNLGYFFGVGDIINYFKKLVIPKWNQK